MGLVSSAGGAVKGLLLAAFADCATIVGGTLRVLHRDLTADFVWEKPDLQNLQWAAFYGDCKHEVLEVTQGHRITLTYNLYYSWIGDVARGVHCPQQLPLYSIVHDLIHEPTFMRSGETSTYKSTSKSGANHPQVVFSASFAAINTPTLKRVDERASHTLSKEST